MKRQNRLYRFALVIVTTSLLLHACSLNAPQSSVTIGTTATPTAPSGSSENNVTATVEATPAEGSNPVAQTPVQALDPCAFITTTDAEPIVGTALIDITAGNDVDDVIGGPLDYCTYKGDDVALVVSFVKSSAVQGSPEWQGQVLQIAQASDPDATVTPPTSEIGEQAYWAVTELSAGWFVAKFPYVFAVVVGGNIGYAEDYKEDLKALAQKIVDQLP